MGHNVVMRTALAVAFAFLLLLATAAFFPGCGGRTPQGQEEEVVDFVIHSILIPREGDAAFLVEWARKAESAADADPLRLGIRFWKREGGTLAEITGEEYRELATRRVGGNNDRWAYSQHTVSVLELAADEATVEIGSLYNPLSGEGVRYQLRREGGKWKKVSEQTVWCS